MEFQAVMKRWLVRVAFASRMITLRSTATRARFDAKGNVSGVEIEYPRDAVRQYLNYAAMYDKGLSLQPAKSARAVKSSRSGSR